MSVTTSALEISSPNKVIPMNQSPNQSFSSTSVADFKNKMSSSFEQCQMWPLNEQIYQEYIQNFKTKMSKNQKEENGQLIEDTEQEELEEKQTIKKQNNNQRQKKANLEVKQNRENDSSSDDDQPQTNTLEEEDEENDKESNFIFIFIFLNK
jgi:hypothetical protein